jgi:hypothetical protein
MTTTEQTELINEAASLLRGVNPNKNADLAPDEWREVELGLARRKVELYEVLHAARPDDTDTADVLAGARARLAALEDQRPA